MLAPTFATCVLTFAPYMVTSGPCACGASLLSTGANIPQVVVVASCNLRWWCFFIQPLVQILHLHSGNMHCVVVYILIYLFIYLYYLPFIDPTNVFGEVSTR